MYCENCGTKLREGMLFCENCGAKISEMTPEVVAEVQVSEEVATEVVADVPVTEETTVVSKKKFPKKLIVAFIVVAVLVGGFFAFKDAILNRIAFLLPAHTHMQLAYKNAANDLAEDATKLTTNISESSSYKDGKISYTVKATLGNEAKKLLETATKVKLGDINQVVIDYEVGIEDNLILGDAKVSVGKVNLLTMNVVMDYDKGLMAISVPELSETAIEFEMESDMDIDMDEFREAMSQTETITGFLEDILPSEELLKDMIPRYATVIIKAMDDVKRDKEKVKVGGVSEKLTALTVKLDDRMLKDIGEAIADELKDDKEFKSYLKNAVNTVMEYTEQEKISNSDFNDGYKEIANGIEEAFEEMGEEEVFQEGIKLVTFVNAKNEIIGFQVDEWVEAVAVKDGKKVAKHVLFTDGDETAEILIKGEENKDVFSGEVSIYENDEELFVLDVDKYLYTDETFELAVSFEVTDEIVEEMFDTSNPLNDVVIKLEVKSTKETAYIAVKGVVGGTEWVAMEVSGEISKNQDKITYPKDVIEVDDIDEWVEDMDLSKLIENLDKSGLLEVFGVDADELKDIIEERMTPSNSYYNQYYYY